MTGCLGRAPLPRTLKKPALDTSITGEEPGLDNDWLLGESSFAENLEETSSGYVNNWGLLLVVSILGSRLLRHQGPEFVQVDCLVVLVYGEVSVLVEVPHADLAEVSRMVLVEVDSVVMLSTSVSATSGMLPVLSYTTVTMAHVASQLSGLFLAGRHLSCRSESSNI